MRDSNHALYQCHYQSRGATLTLTTVMIIVRIICGHQKVLLSPAGDDLRAALAANGVAVDNLSNTRVVTRNDGEMVRGVFCDIVGVSLDRFHRGSAGFHANLASACAVSGTERPEPHGRK